MAFVHQDSHECTKSELDLFSVPATQTSIENGQWVEHHPVASLNDNNSIEFSVSGKGSDYIDLANTFVLVKAQIVNPNGTALADNAPVAPVNLFLHSLFSQVDLTLNDKLITPSNNTYAYRAYLETLLSYGDTAKTSQLTSALWYKDTADNMEATTDQNKGFESRQEFAARSKVIDMMGKIHSDLFFQDRYLLNGVNMRLKLVRSNNPFCIMAGGVNPNYKVVLKEAVLFVRKVKLNPSVRLAHAKALERAPTKYPIKRVETKVFSIPTGTMNVNQDNLFLGQLPKRVIVGFVDNDSFNGAFVKNPFNFKHYGINYLSMNVDGSPVPSKPFQPNFEAGNVIRSYLSLFTGTGMMGHDEGNGINRDEYGGGYSLFAFDLTPDLSESDGDHTCLVKQGNVRLDIQFTTALTRTINAIVYAEFDNIIEIDKARNVLFDYSA